MAKSAFGMKKHLGVRRRFEGMFKFYVNTKTDVNLKIELGIMQLFNDINSLIIFSIYLLQSFL